MFNILVPLLTAVFVLSNFVYLNTTIPDQSKTPKPIESSLVNEVDGDLKLSPSEIKFTNQLKQGKIDFNEFPKPWVFNYNKLLDQNDEIILNLENLDIYKGEDSLNLKSVSTLEFVKGDDKLSFQDSLNSFSEIDLNDGTVKKYLISKQFVNLSNFNGKYYFISDLNPEYICKGEKVLKTNKNGIYNFCKYYEFDPSTYTEKIIFSQVFFQMYGFLQPDLRYVDESSYWLTDAFGDSCTSYSTNTKVSKLDLKEKYSITYTNVCGEYAVTEKINDKKKVLFEGKECPSGDTELCDIDTSGAERSKEIYKSKLWADYEDPVWRNDPPESFECGKFSVKREGGKFSSNSKNLTQYNIENAVCVD